ncbi:SusC/RagA family TonB-linked outer membrane protein [Mariniphaga sediminis]|uniref:SusC/RagA family TonB-linked outer membrane protein n=1 Tax=Mariniphaga sediminis TaxID=1628158 RepID=UPI0035620AFC
MKNIKIWYGENSYYQLVRKMKITGFLLFVTVASLFATETYAQITKLNLRAENAEIAEVLQKVEKQSEFRFFYNERVDVGKRVTIHVINKTVIDILDEVLEGTGINYKIMGQQIALFNRDNPFNWISQQQQRTVSGKVTDSDGLPLPGVTVVIKGTTQGTVTNAAGEYSLSNVSESTILQFSFVGMKTEEVEVGNQSILNVVMVVDAIGIEEVVAIGYGTQKKRDVIGSIASVKSDVIERTSGISNFTSLLQGQAAGASVQTSSGRLGASVDVKIRGLSSISAGTSPLWIIDGIPIIASASTGAEYTAEQSPMSLINQADIESIEILKDAAATSIYGSRGSNGVIIITTKTGKEGKVSVNVDYSTGISDLPFQQVEFVNTRQWFEMKDGMKQSYGLGKYSMSDYYAGKAYLTEMLTREQAESIDTDWRKEAMQRGSFQNVNFSTVGGNEKVQFFVSANYRKDKGVMLNDDLERYGLRTNIDIEASKYFKTGAKINLSLSNSNRGKNFNRADEGNKRGSAGGFSLINSRTAPIEPVYSLVNPNLYYNPYLGNPVALSDTDYLIQDVKMYRALANLYGEYFFPFLTELSVRSELSVDIVQANRNTWLSKDIRADGSWAEDVARTSRTVNYNLFLKYNKQFGEHNVNMVGGTEAQRSGSWYRLMEGQNLVGSYKELGSPSQMITMNSGLRGEGYLLAYFGRANYKLKDRYLAGISLRRDGSSVFTPEFRWGTFVAFSAGWIISEESFMGTFGNKHFLKLRGSYGQTGNASIPSGLDASKYVGGKAYGSPDILAINGTLISSIGVTNLTWETTNNFDVGLDFGFMDNRINGSLAYYNKYVEDLLLATELPFSSGISSIYGNIGDLVNSGVEFNISSVNLESKKFRWQTSFNISYNHNEVKKLVPKVDEAGTGMVSAPYVSKVGYSVRDYYLADFAHVDPETGISMIYALDQDYYNETGVTRRLKDENDEDVLLIDNSANATSNRFHLKGKNRIPKYYGGMTNSFSYKDFDLSFLMTFSGGNYIYDQFMRDNATALTNTGEILLDVYNNYWKKPGDNAKYQRLNWNGNVKLEDGTVVGLGDPRHDTDQFLFKGDYVKLKSVTLGYTLPKSDSEKWFQYFRLYTTIENLYTMTDYPGWDPEGQGTVGQWELPQLFAVTFGLSVKF